MVTFREETMVLVLFYLREPDIPIMLHCFNRRRCLYADVSKRFMCVATYILRTQISTQLYVNNIQQTYLNN